jgi:hypothetical protein
VLKLQLPELVAVVVPSAELPPSNTVTVDPAGALPVRVTVFLEFATPVLITGAVGGAGTVTSNGLEALPVPAEVVSVAVNACEPADSAAVV